MMRGEKKNQQILINSGTTWPFFTTMSLENLKLKYCYNFKKVFSTAYVELGDTFHT